MMSRKSRRMAGVLLVIFPTVIYGGIRLLSLLLDWDSGYAQNQLRQDLWRAGHAHAGVMLILSLVAMRYVDEAELSPKIKWFVRSAISSAAIFLPVAIFLSVLSPSATEPYEFICLAFFGASTCRYLDRAWNGIVEENGEGNRDMMLVHNESQKGGEKYANQ